LEVAVKVAVSGKGGVGKTTLSAMLAGTLAAKGRKVIALDADPDANLAAALGVGPEEEIVPLSEMRELIKERTGAEGGYGGYFKLNPRVDDIPDEYSRAIGNIRLLALGGVKAGGDGCICPASAVLKALLTHVILGRDDALVMDMEAGIEHLGRATAQSMDALVVVVDHSPWSIQTALRVRKLADDLKMKRIFAVANRVDDAGEAEDIRRRLGEIPLIGRVATDERLAESVLRIGKNGAAQPTDALSANMDQVESILQEIESRL